MPIDTNIAALLEQLALVEPPSSLDALRRATDTALQGWHGPLEAVDRMETFAVPTRDGRQIRVRGYWPLVISQSAARQPAIVYAHGGGWCLGTLEVYDNPCRALANATQCVVLSVDYRLAPEHRFPVPLEDFCDALDWVFGEAARLGLDPARIAVGGDSAGGNLAAAACLVARERGGPPIAHQLLLYPPLDASMSATSYRTLGAGLLPDARHHAVLLRPVPDRSGRRQLALRVAAEGGFARGRAAGHVAGVRVRSGARRCARVCGALAGGRRAGRLRRVAGDDPCVHPYGRRDGGSAPGVRRGWSADAQGFSAVSALHRVDGRTVRRSRDIRKTDALSVVSTNFLFDGPHSRRSTY
ncbi:Acetyl esterase [Burkholderia puraquae]|uniref:Acetyl esterase n=1 Tax=Burkholderia puraquae TaxID=1904757 RepID=A0A6J5DB54_9BURK|nr:Acetyl esterase [Burkholderia puraquae]